MATIKKAQRKADEGLTLESHRGKQAYHRMKPYLVYDYLLKQTDEEHLCSANDISGYLEEYLGIYADRRSIYSDIEEINMVLWALENEETMEDAVEVFQEAKEGSVKNFSHI